MNKTLDLITKLSSEVGATKPLPKPSYFVGVLLSVLVFYAIILQIFFGIRSDILTQLSRPLFALEMLLVLALFLSGIVAAALMIYPDIYQKSRFLKLPYVALFLLLMVFVMQFFMPLDAQMALSSTSSHKIECSVCIFLTSLIPATFIFFVIHKGATTVPAQAGLFAVLAASALGYAILRLSEANDSISHLLLWHYFPILLFALLGAALGKLLLKW